jgi:hypothetical protein
MEPDTYQKAKDRVKKKKEFRDHLKSYLVTNLVMLGMGWMFGFFNAWLMVILFWGMGLVFHYTDVYGIPGMGDDDEWEDREIEKELDRMERREMDHQPPKDATDPDDSLDLNEPRPVERKSYNEEDLV